MRRILFSLLVAIGVVGMVSASGFHVPPRKSFTSESFPSINAVAVYIALDLDSKNVVVNDSIIPLLQRSGKYSSCTKRTEYSIYNDKGELLWQFYSYEYDEEMLELEGIATKYRKTNPRLLSPKKEVVRAKDIVFDLNDKIGKWTKEDMDRFLREEVKLERSDNWPTIVDLKNNKMIGYKPFVTPKEKRKMEEWIKKQRVVVL